MTIPPKVGVRDVEVGFAAELLERLRPIPQQWDLEPRDWIFRGQGNAEWGLTAKAIRDHGADFAKFAIPPPGNWTTRLEAELKLLEAFYDGLQDLGLQIPSAVASFRPPALVTASADVPVYLWPLQALAQHHGLPTSLLDWSKRAWVAAYFAATDVLNPGNVSKHASTTHVAVWALQRGTFVDTTQRGLFYEPPSSTNPNLRAQSALFTRHIAEGETALEEYLVKGQQPDRGPLIKRFVLPKSEARELLTLLSLERIDGASMFPGADGVVRAMREKEWR